GNETGQSCQRYQNRDCIGTVLSKSIGDESPERSATDSDESDQAGDEGGHQLVKTERYQMCNNVCGDHENRGSERELPDGDGAEENAARRVQSRCRVDVCRCETECSIAGIGSPSGS